MTDSPMIPQSDPALVEFVGQWLSSSQADEPFLVLSDEEILAMDREIDPAFTLAPWALNQPDMDLSMFLRVGERSLILRGLLDLELDESDGAGSVTTSTDEVLDFAISGRRSGAAMIRAATVVGDFRIGQILAVQPDHGVVVEDVRPEGFHVFEAKDYHRSASELAQWSIPPGIAETGTGALMLREDQWPDWAMNELGVNAHMVELDLFLPADGGEMTEEHCLVASGDDTSVLATQLGGGQVHVEATSRSALTDALRDRMARAVSVVTS